MSDRRLKGQNVRDNRAFGRRATVRHAWIAVGQRQRLSCCIRNLSVGGALLEFEVPAWLPYSFDLLIEDPKMTMPCEVRHRGMHGVGVSFLQAVQGIVLLGAECDMPTRRAAPAPELSTLAGRIALPAALCARPFRVPV